MTKRELRCIELFVRIKAQFLRVLTLDDVDKGYDQILESTNANRQLASRYAAELVLLLCRFTSHMGLDDFNDNWFFYSDYIYQDEDIDALESVQKETSQELNT